MTPDLPPALRAALDRELDGVGRRDLAERAARTSAAYRAGRGSSEVIRSPQDALAYALARLPATYAACAAVFAEVERAAPGFRPQTLLDAGSGTAAASWAAAETWAQLATTTWLDASTPFLEMAARLGADGPPPLASAERLRADLTGSGDWPAADLVVASYALAEIAQAKQADVVQRLWQATTGVLALVEPGTPAGYARILSARQGLVAAGAELLAPCPHAADCPLTSPDWCHFTVRLPRSRDHRMAKSADRPFEDEKFAYLIAARPGVAEARRPARVLSHPRVGKPGIELKVCGPEGLETRFVGRRDKTAHARARRLSWGDPWDA